MAFPQVVGTTTTGNEILDTDFVVNYPASPVTGNLLFCFVRHTFRNNSIWPSGWNELFDDTSDAGDQATVGAWRKVDGTEGATFTITQAALAKDVAIIYEISGAEDPDTQPPEFSTVVVGESTSPDPGSLTPTGGARDYLWLWCGGWTGEQTSPPSGTPTNYSDPIGADTGTVGGANGNCRVAIAERELNAASEDPGVWTISASKPWAAFTIAIHPVSVVAEIPDSPRLVIQGGKLTVS